MAPVICAHSRAHTQTRARAHTHEPQASRCRHDECLGRWPLGPREAFLGCHLHAGHHRGHTGPRGPVQAPLWLRSSCNTEAFIVPRGHTLGPQMQTPRQQPNPGTGARTPLGPKGLGASARRPWCERLSPCPTQQSPPRSALQAGCFLLCPHLRGPVCHPVLRQRSCVKLPHLDLGRAYLSHWTLAA